MANNPSALTAEQTAAIDAGHRSMVLRASAGTGKTFTLVARYLRHVRHDGLRPDQILTLTFTRRAAAEMKKRIVRTLSEQGLRDEAQIAETGPIQTLHGFCERVLRECSVDAGLDPDFEVLDETEAGRRMSEAIHLAIAEVEGLPLAEALLERLAGKAKYLSTSPHSALEEAVRNLVHGLRGSTASMDQLSSRYESPDSVIAFWTEAMRDSVPEAVLEELAAAEPGMPFGVRLRRAYRAAKLDTPRYLPTDKNYAEVGALDLRCAEDSCGLVQLAIRAAESFEARNRHETRLDFVELERATVALLKESPPARTRIQTQYRAILIDEAQDLNPIQHQLIDALGLDRELFVGDAQQSIYGFRQADVELFRRRATQLPTLPLSRNHRSQEGILHFVDALFSELWKGDYLPMARSAPPGPQEFPGVEIWCQKSKDTAQIAQWIADLCQNENPGDVAVLVRSGSYAQALLARLEALAVPARIAGGSERYYLRLEVRDMANLLNALADPHNAFALLAVLRSPIVGVSMETIVQLGLSGSPFDRLLDLTSVETEDVLRLEQFKSWFLPLSQIADRVPAWEILSQALAKSSYFPSVAARPRGVQAIANVRKLLSIAASMPEADAQSFAQRMREIRELRHHEGDAPATEDLHNQVTLMTIHKAKGLEFEVVVMPETLAPERRMGEIEVEKRRGLVTAKFEAGVSMFHSFNTELRKQRDREEELRLLYVALTRAKRRLCLVANPGGKNTTLAGLIPEALGWQDGIPDTIVRRVPDQAFDVSPPVDRPS